MGHKVIFQCILMNRTAVKKFVLHSTGQTSGR